MCLYGKLVRNPKYKKTKKNGGVIPPCYDARVAWIPVGCGNCMECRKQKAREWQVRLLEDIKTHKNGKFITLTFSNESIKELYEKCQTKGTKIVGYELDNKIATVAVRLFLERWRKEHKKSLRHWLVTELGHEGTENIHLHGIIWTDEPMEAVEAVWKYGWVWKYKIERGRRVNYVNAKTVNYMTKYVNKPDRDHEYYKSIILTSPGIGKRYITENSDSKRNEYNGRKTIEYYKTTTGHKIAMPIYWRNHIYNEDERERLWIQKLDKQERWVGGERVDISEGQDDYMEVLKWYRQLNTELGYGNDKTDEVKKEKEQQKRENLISKRINGLRPENEVSYLT